MGDGPAPASRTSGALQKSLSGTSDRGIIRTMKHRHRRSRDSRVQLNLSPEVQDVLLQLKPAFEREFRERFGRNMRPDDSVFWSDRRSGAEPVPMTEEEIEEVVWCTMELAGLDPGKPEQCKAITEDELRRMFRQ